MGALCTYSSTHSSFSHLYTTIRIARAGRFCDFRLPGLVCSTTKTLCYIYDQALASISPHISLGRAIRTQFEPGPNPRCFYPQEASNVRGKAIAAYKAALDLYGQMYAGTIHGKVALYRCLVYRGGREDLERTSWLTSYMKNNLSQSFKWKTLRDLISPEQARGKAGKGTIWSIAIKHGG